MTLLCDCDSSVHALGWTKLLEADKLRPCRPTLRPQVPAKQSTACSHSENVQHGYFLPCLSTSLGAQNPLTSAHRVISGPLQPRMTTCFVTRLITIFAFLRPLISVMNSSMPKACRTEVASTVRSPCILRIVVMCFDPPDFVDW